MDGVFGANLRARRKAAGLSQAALAAAATALPGFPAFTFSQQYIYDLEAGRNQTPNAWAALRLAAALACTPADLYGVTPAEAVA